MLRVTIDECKTVCMHKKISLETFCTIRKIYACDEYAAEKKKKNIPSVYSAAVSVSKLFSTNLCCRQYGNNYISPFGQQNLAYL